MLKNKINMLLRNIICTVGFVFTMQSQHDTLKILRFQNRVLSTKDKKQSMVPLDAEVNNVII